MPATRKRSLWWMAILAMVVLTGITAFGIRAFQKASRIATRQTMCVHNLKFLAISLDQYANDHNGQFPNRLAGLWPDYIVNLQDLICPEEQAQCLREHGVPHPYPPHPDPDTIEQLSSYVYVPGHTKADPVDTVIAYEKRDNHFGKGRSLLYLDGRGAWEPPQNWRNGPPNTTLPPGF